MYPVNAVTGAPFVSVVGGLQLSAAPPVVGGVTVTVALSLAEPPVPLQVSV